MTNKRLPFEPPQPDTPTKLETAATVAAGVALVPVAMLAEPVLRALSIPALFGADDPEPFDAEAQRLALHACGAANTEPPVTDENGDVQCAECAEFVPYATMSLNEDGCFCATCAAKLTANAVADQSDDDAYKL